MERISGATALASAIDAALLSTSAPASAPASAPPPLFVFDFDRTLTNGMSNPGETELGKLVRGGSTTIAALQRARDAGSKLYIITARRPVSMTVQQLFASLDHAQSALSPFFERGQPEEMLLHDEQGNAIPLARGGNVIAADYQKAAALAHIIQEQPSQANLRVFFFDDVVVNSFVVATSTKQHLGPACSAPEITSYWWDTFDEEIGPNPSMKPSHTNSTDSSYADFARHMLEAYGVTAAECDARIEAYRAISTGTRHHRQAGEPVSNGELRSVQAAYKDMHAKMSPLAATLGERFARGPRPPPVGVVPNAAYDAFTAGKALHSAELDAIRASKKEGGSGDSVRSISAGLGGLFGAARGPRGGLPRGPRPPPSSAEADGGGWRAKAASDKARAKAAAALFANRSVASLPPGPLSAPMWETAFQVESPDEGTTGGLSFVATLAGAFAIKSANDLAEEFVGTRFLQIAGVPAPAVRMVHPGDEEHATILDAVEAVAKQYSQRGDAEGASGIMMHALTSMRKFDGPLLLMELVPAALTLNRLGSAQRAEAFLEPSAEDTRARTRLEAIGRLWVTDAVLNFRDRFTSRLNHAEYDAAVALAKSGDSNGAAVTPEQLKVSLTGNCDNVLLTNAPFCRAGFAAIDSHVKLIRGASSAADDSQNSRSVTSTMLLRELGALLEEASSAASSGKLSSAPSRCFDWLRFTIEVVSGHTLSDDALACARFGALRGVAAVPGAVEWARGELKAARSTGAAGGKKWKEEMARIDEDALVSVGEVAEGLLAEHAELLQSLLPADENPAPGADLGDAREAFDPSVLASAKRIGADARLWAALSYELREALINERVLGMPLGEHSTGDFWRNDPV
jgi:hypothetical protein